MTYFAANATAAALAIVALEGELSQPGDDGPGDDRVARVARKSVTVPNGRAAALAAAQQAILGRGPFCPACEEPEPVAASTPLANVAPYGEGRTLGPLLHPGEPPTSLPLALVATMEAVGPGHSLATIRHDGGVGVFVRGDEVIPDVEVVEIGAGIVHLRNAARVEYLALEPPSAKSPKSAKTKKRTAKKKKKKKKKSYEIPGADEAIDCPSKGRCTIDRAFVEKLIARPSLLVKQGRMVPSKRGGRMKGYRLTGARRGTVPALLGMRNGDVVTSIDGQPLATPDAALGMFPKLRNASSVRMTIERRGKARDLELEIR